MAWTKITSRIDYLGVNGGTTTAIDTTGADFFIVAVSSYTVGTGGSETVTDSVGNTYTALTAKSNASYETIRLFYSYGSPHASHTFTYSDTSCYAHVAVIAFSGSHATPFDQQNGVDSTGAVTTLSPGSVTPSENDELVICALGMYSNWNVSLSIDSGFTIEKSATAILSVAIAYKIQTTAGAENPAWSWTTARSSSTVIATFKKAAAGGGGNPYYYYQQAG